MDYKNFNFNHFVYKTVHIYSIIDQTKDLASIKPN